MGLRFRLLAATLVFSAISACMTDMSVNTGGIGSVTQQSKLGTTEEPGADTGITENPEPRATWNANGIQA